MPALAEGDTYDAARVAAVLGLHLVTQVLDEACTIAQASQRIGWPWTCVLSIFRDAKNDKSAIALSGSDKTFIISQGDMEISTEAKDEAIILATSTPQKEETMKMKHENSFIGQGDEEFDMHQEDLTNSTSMFINHLFDMSEVEKEIACEEVVTSEAEAKTEVNMAMVTNLMDSLFNSVVDIATDQIVEIIDLTSGQVEIIEVAEVDEEDNEEAIKVEEKLMKSAEESCYSFLADAYDSNVGKNITFYVDDAPTSEDEKEVEAEVVPIVIEEPIEEHEKIEKCDVAQYEDAYLTLNRDYDQGSDEDGDPVLQDPKGLIMQDVELLTASTSEENLSTHRESEERKELAAISGVSGASGSRKSRTSLISRCRSQGARLLACLRGWWRRKTPGKRKESRVPGSVRGMCPLSPDARRRAASLLDHRDLYSPAPSRGVVWKFNTVNEALVNSSRWKDYTFEEPPAYED